MDLLNALLASTGGIILLVFLGMALIAMEFLVKARGIAGVIGFIALMLYFIGVQGNVSTWMIGLFFIGLLLLIVDGKFLQDGTLAAIGLVFMLIGLVVPTDDLLLGVGVVSALLLGLIASFLSLRFLPKRDMWEKLTLRDRLTAETGYRSMNQAYSALVGRQGTALTDMRPSGTIEIDSKRYSAVSDGSWVKKGSPIKVQAVSGTRILVEAVDEAAPSPPTT